MTDFAIPSRVVVLTALCLAFAGCGSESKSNSIDAARETAASVSAGSPGAVSIDACSLLSADDISGLLGTTFEGESTSTDPRVPSCLWQNPDTYESVSLEIGNSGTAVNNTLPPPEPGYPEVGTPGPDGMRFLGGGSVEFAAGGRSNSVQVNLLRMSEDEANNAAVELARKIGPQLPE